MTAYYFASNYDGEKFQASGDSLQEAFQTLQFNATDYADNEDDAEDLRGKPILVWGWDENEVRHDWTTHFK